MFLVDKGQESKMYREFLIIDIKQMDKEYEQEIHRSRNMDVQWALPATSYRPEAVSVGAEKVLWHGYSAPGLETRAGLELGLMVGYVPACVRPWALFPALPATNEQANSKPSLSSIPWHPEQLIYSTGPARNLSNARENPSSVAWGLRLSVVQLHISIPTTSCVCVCMALGTKPKASCKHSSPAPGIYYS